MAVRDTRFGGNLERANTGIRSLPERNLIEDRMNYGYGQMMNPQGGARYTRYIDDDSYVNPNVFSRQMAVEGFPNAPREIAQAANFQSPFFSSAANLRESINYLNAIKNNPDLLNPMYADLYPKLFDANPSMADLYKSKEEQMEDAGPFEAMQMERYARENPFLKMLGGTQTTDVTDPRGNVTTTEEMVDPGVYAMSPAELSYMYGASTDAPMTTRLNQFYPDEKYLPSPYTPPSDRQPGLDYLAPALPPGNIGFDRSPNPQALPPGNIGFDRSPNPQALPPENIGMDRDPFLSSIPENIGVDRGPLAPEVEDDRSMLEKLAPFLPLMPAMPYLSKGMAREALDLFSPDDIYRDPIMDMANMEQPTTEMSNLETEDILRIMGQYGVDETEARRIYDETMYGYERA